MPLTAFDHVNIRTEALDAMVAWYSEVLGLVTGARPDFGFAGAWLYLGDRALVHLVAVERAGRAGRDGAVTLEHFAFRAEGLAEFRARLDRHGIAHTLDPVPGWPIVQVNFRDPDGNHIHVDFDAAEA